MTDADTRSLIIAIASRERTATQLANEYGLEVSELRKFTKEHLQAIEAVAADLESNMDDESGEPDPGELDNLWISKKTERLTRLQNIADKLYNELKDGSRDPAVLREFRFYLQAVANELGQLLHRGAGESGSDSLSVDMQGVELDNLR